MFSTNNYFRKKNIKQLIIIQGPTASGKTSLSIALAKKLNTVVLSADSRQFYQEIGIGTAKPTKEEMGDVHHYFIDSHSLLEPVTAGQYEQEGLALLEKLFKNHNQIILVGGSGLFIEALTIGLDPLPTDNAVQVKWQTAFNEKGLTFLQSEMESRDPEYFATVDINNPHRLLRGLELNELTGKKMSEIRKNKAPKRPFGIARFTIDLPREMLYERINQRVHTMMEQGLINEVKSVVHLKHLQSLNTVGYSEIFRYLDGVCSLEESVASIQQNSRRYAKRQLTWFRRIKENIWVNHLKTEDQLKFILDQLAKSIPE